MAEFGTRDGRGPLYRYQPEKRARLHRRGDRVRALRDQVLAKSSEIDRLQWSIRQWMKYANRLEQRMTPPAHRRVSASAPFILGMFAGIAVVCLAMAMK